MLARPTIEEFNALREALEAAQSQRDSLAGELRVVRVERDLLKERLAVMMRKIFASKSEARGTDQKDMFFNEAEQLASATQAAPAQEDSHEVDVPGHKRKKRGRKPLDPALPREVVRHELPEAERICPHDGAVLTE